MPSKGQLVPAIGDWVQDWSGDLLIWTAKHAERARRHPSILDYISQIRTSDGQCWLREGRSPSTGAPLKAKAERSPHAE